MRRSELRVKLRELQREGTGDPGGLDALPDLPLRFPLRLAQVDKNLLGKYMDLDVLPRLELSKDMSLTWPEHGKVGSFAAREKSIIERLGPWYVIYQPRILEVSSSVWVAVELVRPVMSVCPTCKRIYPQGYVRCEKCRTKLRDERGVMPFVDPTLLRDEMLDHQNPDEVQPSD